MKKLVSIALLLLFVTPCLKAQRKEISQARSYIKSSKRLDSYAKKMENYDKAEAIVTDLLKDSANRRNVKIYELWLETAEKQYEAANDQLYLKQKYDTVAFFNLTKKLFDIAESFDSVERQEIPNAKDRKCQKKATELAKLRPNLYYGGSFFVKRSEFDNAYRFFEEYIDCTNRQMFGGVDFSLDKKLTDAAYWATYSGYKLKNAEYALKFADKALADTAKAQYVMQYKAEAYRQKGDATAYLDVLSDGFDRYPRYPYFFMNLLDHYTTAKEYDKAIELSDRAIAADSSSVLAMFAKSTLLLNTGRYDECISISDTLIERDENLAEAYYNGGTAYINKAVEKETSSDYRKYKNDVKRYYTMAKLYLERYRQLSPDMQDKWAPALYRVYLNLNMGKQFDEMDKILNGK